MDHLVGDHIPTTDNCYVRLFCCTSQSPWARYWAVAE